MKLRIVHENWPAGWVGQCSQKLTRSTWWSTHPKLRTTIRISIRSLGKRVTNTFVSPWVVIISPLLRSGRLSLVDHSTHGWILRIHWRRLSCTATAAICTVLAVVQTTTTKYREARVGNGLGLYCGIVGWMVGMVVVVVVVMPLTSLVGV